MRILKSPCPCCGYEFTSAELRRSWGGLFGLQPKPMACALCGASVTWSRWPWRVVLGGAVALLCLGIFEVFSIINHSPGSRWPSEEVDVAFLALAVCVALSVASLMTKLVPIPSANQQGGADGRQPSESGVNRTPVAAASRRLPRRWAAL